MKLAATMLFATLAALVLVAGQPVAERQALGVEQRTALHFTHEERAYWWGAPTDDALRGSEGNTLMNPTSVEEPNMSLWVYDGKDMRHQSFQIDSAYATVLIVSPYNEHPWAVKTKLAETLTTILSVPPKQVFPDQIDSLAATSSSFQPSYELGTNTTFTFTHQALQVRTADTITHLPISPIIVSPILEELRVSNHLSNFLHPGGSPVTSFRWIYPPSLV